MARLYPAPIQLQKLDRQGHTARALWNLLHEWYSWGGRGGSVAKRPSYQEMDRQLRDARSRPLPGWEWLAQLPAQASQQVLRHYLRAWERCFKGLSGPPRFKHRTSRMAVDVPQAADLRVVHVNRRWGEVTVLLVGRVRFRWTRPLPVTAEATQGRITGARLLKDPLGWHICFRIHEAVAAVEPREDPAIGVDLGVVHTIALSDGRNLDMPGLLRRGEARRLRALQHKAARRRRAQGRGVPQSEREREAYRRIAALRAREARRRADWIHKATTQIATSYGTVVVEDLNIAGMTRSARGTAARPGKNVRAKAGLNRAVLGMAWGRAQWMLAYKAADQGGRLVKVAAHFSSQTCAECGHVGGENRRSRDHFRCVTCGYEAAADTNAARVLLRRGLAATSGTAPGYGAAGRGAFAVRRAVKRQPGTGAVRELSVTMGCQNVGASRASPRTEEGNLSVTDRLVIRGAREHNLKNVHLDLPRNALIVFTGLSGSGKSSLAFDTIYA